TGILRDREHPAHFAAALFCIYKVGNGLDFESAFDDPISTCEPSVQKSMLDITRHLLGADQHALNFRIVDGREIGAAVGVNVEPGAREQCHGRVLEAALRNSKPDLHRTTSGVAASAMLLVKHDRVPS